ncbi:hypothetical protein ABFS82_08G036300 [Erythranthe guttata]
MQQEEEIPFEIFRGSRFLRYCDSLPYAWQAIYAPHSNQPMQKFPFQASEGKSFPYDNHVLSPIRFLSELFLVCSHCYFLHSLCVCVCVCVCDKVMRLVV